MLYTIIEVKLKRLCVVFNLYIMLLNLEHAKNNCELS